MKKIEASWKDSCLTSSVLRLRSACRNCLHAKRLKETWPATRANSTDMKLRLRFLTKSCTITNYSKLYRHLHQQRGKSFTIADATSVCAIKIAATSPPESDLPAKRCQWLGRWTRNHRRRRWRQHRRSKHRQCIAKLLAKQAEKENENSFFPSSSFSTRVDFRFEKVEKIH